MQGSHKSNDVTPWFFDRCHRNLHTSKCSFTYFIKRISFLKNHVSFQFQNALPWNHYDNIKVILFWLLYHLKQTEHYYIIIIHCYQHIKSFELSLLFNQRGLSFVSARCKTHYKFAMLWSSTLCYCWLNHYRNFLELPAQLPSIKEVVRTPVFMPLLHCNCACMNLAFYCFGFLGFQT